MLARCWLTNDSRPVPFIRKGDTMGDYFCILVDNDPKPAANAICPTHEIEMWWDGGEPGWYCHRCHMWHDGGPTRMVRPGYWLPKGVPIRS
jgi:hypothetical protein